MIKKLKLFFSVVAWLSALPVVLLETQISGELHAVIEDAALLSFSGLLLAALVGLRAQYLLVTIGLFFIGALGSGRHPRGITDIPRPRGIDHAS